MRCIPLTFAKCHETCDGIGRLYDAKGWFGMRYNWGGSSRCFPSLVLIPMQVKIAWMLTKI